MVTNIVLPINGSISMQLHANCPAADIIHLFVNMQNK